MIDIHCHALFGVDDGAPKIEVSLELLKDAYDHGTTDVVLTPHFWKGIFAETPEELAKRKALLDAKLAAENIPIKTHIGNELYMCRNLDEMLDNLECNTMAGTNYILTEFSMERYAPENDEYLYNVIVSGYRPIIAHPERYKYVQDDPSIVNKWIREGCLLQANADQLFDKKGLKVIDYLIENGKLSFIASDGHGTHRPVRLDKGYGFIEQRYGKDIAELLFTENPRKLIVNADVFPVEARRKKSLFTKILR